MTSFKQAARAALDAVGLSRLYVRYHEWRISRDQEPPPRTTDDGVPLPPLFLMTLVSGADWRWFVDSGATIAEALDRYAQDSGCGFAQARRILDFGCGCGRVIRNLPKLTRAELFGVDSNATLTTWCSDNLPGRFARNEMRPPLKFPDQHFDVTYLISVFTHMRRETQMAWLAELHRITCPNGLVMVTFHDEDHATLPRLPDVQTALKAEGFHVYNNRFEGSNLMATYQTRETAQRMFGVFFEVVRIVPSGETDFQQALAVLRRR
jgi:SAM-dependent methyltransferase